MSRRKAISLGSRSRESESIFSASGASRGGSVTSIECSDPRLANDGAGALCPMLADSFGRICRVEPGLLALDGIHALELLLRLLLHLVAEIGGAIDLGGRQRSVGTRGVRIGERGGH